MKKSAKIQENAAPAKSAQKDRARHSPAKLFDERANPERPCKKMSS